MKIRKKFTLITIYFHFKKSTTAIILTSYLTITYAIQLHSYKMDLYLGADPGGSWESNDAPSKIILGKPKEWCSDKNTIIS